MVGLDRFHGPTLGGSPAVLIAAGVMGKPAAVLDASGNMHIVVRGADRY